MTDLRRDGMTTQVFVVGTGRCGTASVAALLSALPGANVVHEASPRLLREVQASLRGARPRHELVDLLRRTRDPAVIGGSRLSGEANQRLSFLLPALLEAFPSARIVWLLRDGRDAVASMQHRLWYHPREVALRSRGARPWATYRIQGDETGDLSSATWARLDRFARCCSHWSYANRLIARETARLSAPVLPVRIECLRESLPALWSFLDLRAPLPVSLPRANAASGGRPPAWRLWSRRERATFASLCGAIMDRHYPVWKDEMRWSPSQEVAALLGRELGALRSFLRVRSRPLRARVGLVRKGQPRETAWS
jgi:hypothetical protein